MIYHECKPTDIADDQYLDFFELGVDVFAETRFHFPFTAPLAEYRKLLLC